MINLPLRLLHFEEFVVRNRLSFEVSVWFGWRATFSALLAPLLCLEVKGLRLHLNALAGGPHVAEAGLLKNFTVELASLEFALAHLLLVLEVLI